MNKDDTVYLHHILECIRRITEDIVEGRVRFPNGEIRQAELHCYKAHGIGRRKMKVKRVLD